AVRQWRAVAGGEGAIARIEARPQPRELLQRGIGANVVVGFQAQIGHDEVLVEALPPRGGRFHVTLAGEPVLLLAPDTPALRHELGALPHRKARPRLDDGRQDWL